jgi:hypothetical protein
MQRRGTGPGAGAPPKASAGDPLDPTADWSRVNGAITADKGEILYEVRTGRTGMAPPITYKDSYSDFVSS